MFVMVAAAINTAISLVYYLRVAKTMCMDPQPDPACRSSFGFLPTAFVLAIALPVLSSWASVPDLIAPWTQQATAGLVRLMTSPWDAP